jgi:hypothetical protein
VISISGVTDIDCIYNTCMPGPSTICMRIHQEMNATRNYVIHEQSGSIQLKAYLETDDRQFLMVRFSRELMQQGTQEG